jgi:hypothetical protein
MSSYYLDGDVFILGVTHFEPYLSKRIHPLKDSIFCDDDLIKSPAFSSLVTLFYQKLKVDDKPLYSLFTSKLVSPIEETISLTILLLHFNRDDVVKSHPEFASLLSDKGLSYYKLLHAFFQYWLGLTRLASLDDHGELDLDDLKPRMLFLRKSVFHIYNTLKSNVLMKEISLETDFSAGFLAGFTTRKINIPYPSIYQKLNDISFISASDLNLPYTASTKRNKRVGTYHEAPSNPLEGINLSPSEWLVLPLKCGKCLIYFYFSFHFANMVLGLLNLFAKADIEECTRKPDILIVFGGDKGETTGTYYEDKENDMIIGYVSKTDDADYFGYVKKLILTCYNIKMIEKGNLPIHGSMVNVTLKGGYEYNVLIMGDSGAGKSESIEAFRHLAHQYLESINIVFDDMGTLFFEGDKVYASGTEIGAFVRLDDLELGYAFSHLNDALMYNVGEPNARLVYPCSTFEEVNKRYPINLFLYANNYEDTDSSLQFFTNYLDFLPIVEKGERRAKGTTSEVGLVSSYFANPFGPVQKQKETHTLVLKYFKALSEKGTKLGEIYTRLAVKGFEEDGPYLAAKCLLDIIEKKVTNHD